MVSACLPIKVTSIHVCYTMKRSAFEWVLPVIKQLMGPHLRQRLLLHVGGDKEIITDLQRYGLRKMHKSVGGNVEDDVTWTKAVAQAHNVFPPISRPTNASSEPKRKSPTSHAA